VPQDAGRRAVGLQDPLAARLEFIKSVSSTQNDARVAVGRLGPGPTQLNCRVGFAAVRGNDPAERRRSAIVPLSLLHAEDGHLTAPHWVLQISLRHRAEQVTGGVWAGLAAVRAQLHGAFDAAQPRLSSRSSTDCLGARCAAHDTKCTGEHA